jgi:hypothetical protein
MRLQKVNGDRKHQLSEGCNINMIHFKARFRKHCHNPRISSTATCQPRISEASSESTAAIKNTTYWRDNAMLDAGGLFSLPELDSFHILWPQNG